MLKYVFKTLLRHRARSLLTVTGAAVALFVFCIVSSVQEGLDRLTSDADSDRSLIVFQENRFCPTTSRLPEDYSRTIMKIPGVKDVLPIQVWTNNCRASLDIVVFNGADPKKIQTMRPLKLVSGSWSQFETLRDGAILGRNIATRRGLRVGDQFTIGEISVKIAGVFESDVPSEENLIYTNLAFLQYTRGKELAGLVTQHEVLLQPNADADRVAVEIDAALRANVVATKTRRKGAFQASTLSDLVDLIGFAHWLGYACVGLVMSLVATTTIMSVQDRLKEYAVLQTIGVRPFRTMRLVLAESTFLCSMGGIAGTSLALLALYFGGFAIGAEGATIAFRPSIGLGLISVGTSIVVGVLAGLPPALQTARMSIVNALRTA
ncbi:MAG: ABC transporter permease [Pirellulaceae bacterium]|nr:ABC transporter permease [Pirellulaceae bacterium]